MADICDGGNEGDFKLLEWASDMPTLTEAFPLGLKKPCNTGCYLPCISE